MTEVTPSLGNYYMMPLIVIDETSKTPTASSDNYHILFQYKDKTIQFYVIAISEEKYKGIGVVDVQNIDTTTKQITILVLQGQSDMEEIFDIKGQGKIEGLS